MKLLIMKTILRKAMAEKSAALPMMMYAENGS
jgi:hypothetical protein